MELFSFLKKFKKVPEIKRDSSKENKTLCMAPWTHTYINPQSERRLCCASREQHTFVHQYIDQPGQSNSVYKPTTLEEHWNSDFLKSVRRRMMAGETIPECEICNDQVLNIHTYRNYFNDTLFPHLREEVFKYTEDDGTTTLKPRSFDYRISNLCNYKCRMCGEQLSSSWESEKRKYDRWDAKNDPWMVPEQKKVILDFQKNVVEKEFTDAIERSEVEEIYWVGGEPLIWPFHWKSMKRIMEKGDAHKIFCRYNTNLSLINYRGINLFDDYLVHFKGYNVCASIDAPGEIGVYLRTGLKWDQWLDNFKYGCKYKDEKGDDSIVMDITLTLPGLFAIEELLDYALELDVKIYVKTIFAFDSSIVLSPMALPREILEPFIDSIIERIKPKVNYKTKVLVETLEQIKSKQTFQEAYPDDWKRGFKQGKANTLFLESIRHDTKLTIEDIFKPNKDIQEWWRQEL